MKIWSHIIKVDTGLAPNPFWDYCTTAVCTPSHKYYTIKPGDWLIGVSSKEDGNRLVYPGSGTFMLLCFKEFPVFTVVLGGIASANFASQ